MLLVVDANVFIGELLRNRGRELVADDVLTLVISESASDEARHEIPKRLERMIERSGMSGELAQEIRDLVSAASEKVRAIPEEVYRDRLEEARERIPRDPNDAPTVALALAFGGDGGRAGIWTMDGDFLGCGVPVWTTETLAARLARVRRHRP